jgi:penicillin-binding protein 1A
MGITSPLTNFPSEVLGAVAVSPLQMADAYATLASGGVHHPPTAISRVVFPDGSVVHLGNSKGNRVFSQGQAYAATQVLKGVLDQPGATAYGSGTGCPAAGKTGTTTSFTDAYFVGYTPQFATSVWVGFPDSTESMGEGAFGGTLAAPIWQQYMEAARNGYCDDFPAPAVPWTGKPFFGPFSTSGHSVAPTSTSGFTTVAPTTASPTTTNPGSTPSTNSSPPPPTGNSPSGGASPPPGFGNGHLGNGNGGGKTH